MRTWAPLLAFLLVGPSVYAQENCFNAIDDDGDGLVDLNDTADCSCALPPATYSLLPNPSLERFDAGQSGCASVQPGGLPDGTNQANCLTDWQRASLGTTDAWNAFTFTGAGPDFPLTLPQPLPSGSGVAGFWVGIRDEYDSKFYNGNGTTTQQYREYLAACLTNNQRMERGQDYRLTFSLGFMEPQISPGEDGPISIASPDSVELNVYGIRRCDQLYFGPFYSCPETAGAEGYELIRTITVSGKPGRWTDASLDFTAMNIYEAFAIGGSCAPDRGRPDGGLYRNYYFIDDLILNTVAAFAAPVAGPVQVDGLTVCDDITLTGQVHAGASYQWYRDGVTLPGATAYSLALTAGSPVDGSYVLRITTATGCATTAPVLIQQPIVSDLFSDTVGLCAPGDTVVIKPRRQTGATFRWSDGSTADKLAVATPGTYRVTVTEACIEHEESVVVVEEAPLTYTLEQLTTGCPGDSVTVRLRTNALRPTISFRSFPAETRLAHRDGLVTVLPGETPAILAFIGNGCTLVLDTLWLTTGEPLEDIEAEVVQGDCTQGGSITLLLPTSGLPYRTTWYRDGQPLPKQQEALHLDELETGLYRVVVANATGCTRDHSFAITGRSEPVAIRTEAPYAIRPGESITLLTNLGEQLPQGGQISWSPAQGLSCSTCPAPAAPPRETTVYTVSYTDSSGCTSSDRVRVEVLREPRVYVPSAFSPGSGDDNARFTIYQGEGVVAVTALRVYGRWGELVWEQASGEDTGWDGTYRGKLLSSGVYVYVGKLLLDSGKERIIKGSVTLVR